MRPSRPARELLVGSEATSFFLRTDGCQLSMILIPFLRKGRFIFGSQRDRLRKYWYHLVPAFVMSPKWVWRALQSFTFYSAVHDPLHDPPRVGGRHGQKRCPSEVSRSMPVEKIQLTQWGDARVHERYHGTNLVHPCDI